ncbi:hypothetical protein ACLOJK_000151 [Asimina triloba]
MKDPLTSILLPAVVQASDADSFRRSAPQTAATAASLSGAASSSPISSLPVKAGKWGRRQGKWEEGKWKGGKWEEGKCMRAAGFLPSRRVAGGEPGESCLQ